MKIVIGSDHGGFKLKEALKKIFAKKIILIDLGTDSEKSVDYPDFAKKVALKAEPEKIRFFGRALLVIKPAFSLLCHFALIKLIPTEAFKATLGIILTF